MIDQIIELEITDLAFDGKAVGHYDGKVVFVNGGLPGELVRARIFKEKPRYSAAICEEILRKSDIRIAPRCRHFGTCGGCTWQDLEYQQQLSFKKNQTIECLARLGSLEEVIVHDVVGSIEQFHYRNKMEFSFHADEDHGFTLGLHNRGRWDSIFDLEHCFITPVITEQMVIWMRNYVREQKIEVYDVREHTGFLRFFMIRQAHRTQDLMVNLVTNYGDFPHRDDLIKSMTAAFPQISTIVHNQNGLKSNIATGEIETVLFGRGYIEELLFTSRFRIRANSFFQTNTLQAETLYRIGFDMLKARKTDRVLDLYCGTGSIGILLAPHVKSVLGVELVADAIVAANENAALNNITNISFREGSVQDFLRKDESAAEAFDAIIIDPPRAGLHPKALKQLIKMSPPKLLYISCNPSTFARDAKMLIAAGYQLPEVRPVDMFPHTMHIELVGLFSRL